MEHNGRRGEEGRRREEEGLYAIKEEEEGYYNVFHRDMGDMGGR